MIRGKKKLPAGVTAKIPELIKYIRRDSDVIAIHAIGGLASGKLDPLSDLDFVITLDPEIGKQERFEKRIELIGHFTTYLATDEVDLLILNDLPLHFAYQVIKGGKILYRSDSPKYAEQIEKTVKLYLDFRYFRDEFNNEFLKAAGYHG